MTVTRSGAGCAATLALLITVSGCGGGSTPLPSHPDPTSSATGSSAAAPISTGCSPNLVPTGYTIDAKHSGKLTAHSYSAAAEVQAALEYDQLQSGAREVFVHSAGRRTDGVATCVAMQFPSAHLAGRFFMSYRALRKQAGSLVAEVSIPGGASGLSGATGYLERDQSFRGYQIASTDVIEFSGQDGRRLDIVSVAGATPSRSLGHKLLVAMANQ